MLRRLFLMMTAAALVAGGIVLGWLGSFIAATRELRGIEPK